MDRLLLYYITLTLVYRHVKGAPPVFTNINTDGSTRITVLENNAVATTVFTLAATDTDPDPLTFRIVTINGAGLPGDFNRVGSEIRVANMLDFETTTTYTLVVSVDDGNSAIVTGILTIDIGDVNDNIPVITGTFTVSVDEEQSVGTLVPFVITVNDGDAGDTTSFTLTGGHSAFFQVDSGDGSVRFAQKLDRDGVGAILVYDQLTLTVTDSGGNSASTPLTVTLLDINDEVPQCTPSSYFASTAENTLVGTVVQTLTCTDADSGVNGNVVLSISSGDDALPKFAINGINIETTVNPIDYESLAGQSYQYKLIVFATDGGTAPNIGIATVYVTVASVNEAAPVWAPFTPVYNASIPYTLLESTVQGVIVLTVAATDADDGADGSVSYQLVSVVDDSGTNRPGVFTLDANTGQLATLLLLDRDTSTGGVASYDVTVRAIDAGTTPLNIDRTVTFSIVDVNDIAPVFSQSSYSVTIAETLPVSSSVVPVLATDLDETTTTIVYAIQAGDPTLSFTVSAAGLIEVQNNIDLDQPINKPNIYTLQVIARDGGALELTGTASVTIIITAINEHTPVFGATVPPSPVSIAEDISIGTRVATVIANDDDYGNDGLISYSITSGNTNTAFSIDANNGEIKTFKALDFENVNLYQIEVTATDGGTAALLETTTVDIMITNVNEHAPSCTSNNVVESIAEDAAVNDPVAALTCTDSDAGDVLAYSITNGNTGNAFSLDPVTGTLRLATTLDYETINLYALSVDVIDQASPVKTTLVQIQVRVTPVNEFSPVFPVGGYTISLQENQAIGPNFLTVIATDNDQGASHGIPRYSIISGDSQGQFSVDSVSGQIRLIKAVDREAIASYNLGVRATDSLPSDGDERLTDTTVVITITDINDNPPTFTPTTENKYVLETAPINSVIATLVATDDDIAPNNVLTYSISSDPSGLFGVTGNQLILTALLDFESTVLHTVVVQAADTSLTGLATILVNVLSDNDNPPVFNVPNALRSISESTPVGTSIFDASASDNDVGTGSDVSYYIISGDPTNTTYFINQGKVFLWSQLDFDIAPQTYNLTLKVEDTGGLFDTMWLFLTLTDENDEYPVFTQNTYNSAIDENLPANSPVVTVLANDRDSGVNGQVVYSVVSGDGASSFAIDPTSGAITTTSSFDFEVKHIYNLVIEAVDGGMPQRTSSSLAIININDMNDNAPLFVPADVTVNTAEDSPVGTPVYTVNANDIDSAANSNNVYTYVVTNTFFEVNPMTGVIRVKAVVDRETLSRHVLMLKAIDQGAPAQTGTATLTITLDDVNDNTPIITGTYDMIVQEDTSVKTLLFTIAATDLDTGLNGQLSYLIVAGNTNTDFIIDIDGGFVQINNPLDRERTASYSLQIRVNDNGVVPNSDFITVTLTIGDVNDNDPVFSGTPYTFNIAENEVTGTLAGTLVALDADAGVNAVLDYSLLNFWTGDSSHFVTNSVTGEITSTRPLDRETIPSYEVWCRVQDGGAPKRQTYINATILVTDRNDNFPVFDSSSYSVTTTENSVIGTTVLGVTVTDKDIGVNQDFTLSIDTSTPDGVLADTHFTIDTATQILSVKSIIDREAIQVFTFHIIAVDKGAPPRTSSSSVLVTVLDINDNAPIFVSTFYNTEVGYAGQCNTQITTISATDQDIGANGEIVYFLVPSSYDSLFSLEPNTGILSIKTAATSNFNHLLVARARDNGPHPKTSLVGASIRVDTFIPNIIVITFNLKIGRIDFLAKQSEFIVELQKLVSVRYPRAIVRVWCIEERAGTAVSPPTRRRLLADGPVSVHVYTLRDNATESESNKNQGKTFLTYDEFLSFFTSDPNGTPSSGITGTNLDYYAIETVKPYQESTIPWEQTSEGIAIIVVISLILAALLILLFYLCFRRYRQKQRSMKPDIIQNRELAKVPIVKSEVPDLDLKKHPTPAVLSLPMPVASKALSNKKYNEDFFWNSSPISTGGNRFQTIRSPLPDVENSSNINERYFDGIAVDPVSGKIYEYNTKSNDRKWLATPEGKSARVSNLIV